MLPKKAIQEFQEIYEKECGIELTEDEARRHGEDFLSLFELITRPVKNRHSTDSSEEQV